MAVGTSLMSAAYLAISRHVRSVKAVSGLAGIAGSGVVSLSHASRTRCWSMENN